MKKDLEIRYLNQISLTEIGLSGQQLLSNARVLCVGAGGLGSSLLFYLAAAGVGTLGIIDDDQVELNNLHRQILYTTQQVGQKKATTAGKQLLALNPNIKIDIYEEALNQKNAKELISAYDIVADCSDNFITRYLINDQCFAEKKPFVSASLLQFQGQCSFFLGEKGPCYRCLFPFSQHETETANCNQAGVLGVLPGMLGILQATQILKWILKLGDLITNHLLLVDIETMHFRKMRVMQDPNCQLCVHSNLAINPADNIENIDPIQLQSLINNRENYLLLDVRSLEEHNTDHLGGQLIPLIDLPKRLHELDRQLPIIVYCHSGSRSKAAVKILQASGFREVKHLAGGLAAYKKEIQGNNRCMTTQSQRKKIY